MKNVIEWIKKWWQLIFGVFLAYFVYREVTGEQEKQKKIGELADKTKAIENEAVAQGRRHVEEATERANEEKEKRDSDIKEEKKKSEEALSQEIEEKIEKSLENSDSLGSDFASAFGAEHVKNEEK